MPIPVDYSDSSVNIPHRTLTRKNGSSIAYHKLEGKSPGVTFMTGFMSDMNGEKALALEQLCRELGHAFLRFDYQGHGNSSGEFKGFSQPIFSQSGGVSCG